MGNVETQRNIKEKNLSNGQSFGLMALDKLVIMLLDPPLRGTARRSKRIQANQLGLLRHGPTRTRPILPLLLLSDPRIRPLALLLGPLLLPLPDLGRPPGTPLRAGDRLVRVAAQARGIGGGQDLEEQGMGQAGRVWVGLSLSGLIVLVDGCRRAVAPGARGAAGAGGAAAAAAAAEPLEQGEGDEEEAEEGEGEEGGAEEGQHEFVARVVARRRRRRRRRREWRIKREVEGRSRHQSAPFTEEIKERCRRVLGFALR